MNHQKILNKHRWEATEAVIAGLIERYGRFGMSRELAGVAVTEVWHYLATELKFGSIRRVRKIISYNYEQTKCDSVNLETYRCQVEGK